jgi:murein DD-endopeptidase MepM/ murein hydrolase activator NlpD
MSRATSRSWSPLVMILSGLAAAALAAPAGSVIPRETQPIRDPSELHATASDEAACRADRESEPLASAYGWPVKPFHRQHPVRGYFGDPRIGPDDDGTIHRTFHFGVDVSAPDGTLVYATASGVVAANALHPDVVRILFGNGVEFSYWHIAPSVRPGQRVVAYETVIGRIEAGWGHVHFSEMRSGLYVNPLRPGAMGPYEDETCPSVKQVRFERDGVRAAAGSVGGVVHIVVGGFDPPALSAPAPWNDMPVTPALIRWRIVTGKGRGVRRWETVFDVRWSLPSGGFDSVYAIRTRQNRPNRPGTYRFYLARDWNSAQLRDGAYGVEVQVVDSSGNRSTSSRPFAVVN